MKRTAFLPLLLISFSLAACSGEPVVSSEPTDTSGIVDIKPLKDLLAKQDASPIYTKMFTSQFSQNYEFLSSVHGEDGEQEAEFYSYRGGGFFGCLYEVDEDAYSEVQELEREDFFDYLSRGKGSYGMMQTAAMVSYHYDFDGDSNKTESLQCLDFLQRLETVFGENSVQVYNSLSYRQHLDGDYDQFQSFNGIIDKATLFDTISPRALSEIFASTNLYDGQHSCEVLDRIYLQLAQELKEKTDQELSDFIKRNDIRIEEEGESTLVHFKVGDERLRDTLDENDIIPGAFEGTLTYEKASGKFDAYDYKIVYMVNESDESTGDIHAVSMEFKATGYSKNQKYDQDLYIEPNPVVYDDGEIFLNDVIDQVVPPMI